MSIEWRVILVIRLIRSCYDLRLFFYVMFKLIDLVWFLIELVVVSWI